MDALEVRIGDTFTIEYELFEPLPPASAYAAPQPDLTKPVNLTGIARKFVIEHQGRQTEYDAPPASGAAVNQIGKTLAPLVTAKFKPGAGACFFKLIEPDGRVTSVLQRKIEFVAQSKA